MTTRRISIDLRLVVVLVAAMTAIASPTSWAVEAETPQADPDCTFSGPLCEKVAPDLDIQITTLVQTFSDQGQDQGAAGEVLCPVGDIRLIREANLADAPEGEANYAGNRCADPDDVAPGIQQITSADITLALPAVTVNHNPHSEFFVANLPTWFWHTGPTTHTQPVAIALDSGGRITGTYTGAITRYCWTVDDPRAGELTGQVHDPDALCPEPRGVTTHTSDVPGEDSEDGAAATHTWTTRGFDSTITHTAVWEGSITVTGAPDGLLPVGLELALRPSIVRGQTTVPIRQIIPVPVPDQDQP